MVEDGTWLIRSVEDHEDPEGRTVEGLRAVEEEKKRRLKASRPGRRGKRPVKRIDMVVQERISKRGPLVIITGQGPKSRTRFNVECNAELRDKLDRLTVGPRGHVAALLISWALDELDRQGQCMIGHSIKD